MASVAYTSCIVSVDYGYCTCRNPNIIRLRRNNNNKPVPAGEMLVHVYSQSTPTNNHINFFYL